MPIKVRCKSCETVLNLADQAAGKVVKCKQCGERVRVPAPKGARPAAARAPHEAPGKGSDDPLAGLDLRRVEDTKRKVCPGCAKPVDLDTVECPNCGVTIATGTLSLKQRIRHERKGPPPEEFYGAIWSNGWKFLKKHWGYGIRTAMIWSLTLSMSLTSLYSLNYYVKSRTAELQKSAADGGEQIKISGDVLTITVPKEKGTNVVYDRTFYTTAGEVVKLRAPHVQPYYEPPSAFWIFLTIVFQLGFGGWAWTLAVTIARLTLTGEKRIKRFPMDFFGNLTMGFRFYVWPTVLLMPFLWISAVIGAFNPLASWIITSALMVIPLLVLPAAVIHMTQNYQYRSWLLWWMAKDTFHTIGPSVYIFVLNIFMVLLVPLGVAITMITLGRRIIDWLLTQEAVALAWAKGNIMDMGEGNLQFMFYELPIVFTFCFLVFFIVCGLMSFPAVFMMRVIGLFGVYFKPDLSLVNEFPDLEVAGFGPRFLAYLIDSIIMTLLVVAGGIVGSLFGLLFHFYGWGELADFLALIARGVASLILIGFYFASMESGASRATLGKASIGLMVLRDDDKPMPRQQAYGRAASAFVTALTFYLGFVMCAFRADRRAMHDIMSKSKVVWRGEEL
ncbi:MAG: RDD family protein [Planctomycetaceae bacterium]